MGFLERIVDGHLASQGRREQFTNLGADALILRDRSKLHSSIRNRLYGWMDRIGSVHGVQRHPGKRNLHVFWVGIERSARTGRNIDPPFPGSNQLGVMLGRGPADELLCSIHLLRAGRNGQSPNPEPVSTLAKALVGGKGKAQLVTDLGGLARYEGRSNRCVDPHATLAGLEQRKIFREAVATRSLWPRFLQYVDVVIERALPLRLIELWVPLFVKPAGTKRVGHGSN